MYNELTKVVPNNCNNDDDEEKEYLHDKIKETIERVANVTLKEYYHSFVVNDSSEESLTTTAYSNHNSYKKELIKRMNDVFL